LTNPFRHYAKPTIVGFLGLLCNPVEDFMKTYLGFFVSILIAKIMFGSAQMMGGVI
jgi:hypothetical protein